MTDRHAGYIVTLGSDVREDDAAEVMTALRMVKGVADVQPVSGGHEQSLGAIRERVRWQEKLLDLMKEMTVYSSG